MKESDFESPPFEKLSSNKPRLLVHDRLLKPFVMSDLIVIYV